MYDNIAPQRADEVHIGSERSNSACVGKVLRALLIGEWYSENTGDGVICETTERMLRSLLGQEYVFERLDLSGMGGLGHPSCVNDADPTDRILARFLTHFGKNNRQLRNYCAFLLLKRYFRSKVCGERYDIAIFCGGQLFMDYFYHRISFIVRIATRRNVPICFSACGYYERNDNATRWAFRRLFKKNKIDFLSVRDSYESMREVLADAGVLLRRTPDAAMICAEIFNIAACPSGIIGIGIINIPQENTKIIEVLCELTYILDANSQTWQLFCNGAQRDYLTGKRILNRRGIPEAEHEAMIARPKSPMALIQLISGFSTVFALRLHAHIVAYSLGVPSAGAVWDGKVDCFAREMHCEDCFLRMDELTGQRAFEVLKRAQSRQRDTGQYSHIKREVYKNIEAVALICRGESK